MLLPRVSEEVHSTFAECAVFEYENDKDFMEKNLILIKNENPEILQFIKNWCDSLTGEYFARTIIGMLGIYKLLHNQAEVNALESDQDTAYNNGKEGSEC